ncbi:hypothetical protein C1J03_08370 [Sulfitobacter sp. SK012]|uniref:hypothetical protein n=1 Tax=Sulfitobacter sp. SK012 TaxID=1389005 RepID=UPI000E0C26D4|nr:hypothetical protein [Sulfitobacter sp. SK012]AXI46028.1 hypothetical protein C1J03_08370 [Sulfitobacter sp. SK012]
MRCLIVEMDPIFSEMLCDKIESLGHSATRARTVQDAKPLLQKGLLDIVMFDHAMQDAQIMRLTRLKDTLCPGAKMIKLTDCEMLPDRSGVRLAPALAQVLAAPTAPIAQRPGPLAAAIAWLT